MIFCRFFQCVVLRGNRWLEHFLSFNLFGRFGTNQVYEPIVTKAQKIATRQSRGVAQLRAK